ncbi:MAG: TetR/AcrR family transcriptional regulator [Salibacteraceae bacterium]
MEEKKRQILEQADEVFMRLGIKSVTMDDMARNLGISKKTLYQYVSDKNDLVFQTLQINCDYEEKVIRDICTRELNAIDESFEVSKWVVGQLKRIHPSIHYDLEKYHPEAFHHFRKAQTNTVYECIEGNLRKGMQEGLYRDDLNVHVIATVYLARMDVVFDGQLFPPTKYDFAEVYLETFRYHIRGIASEKGIEYLVEKVKKETTK